MTELGRSFKRLSAAEARNALYIDFEGQKDKPPVFLGVLRRPGRGPQPFVQPAVVDETFGRLTGSWLGLRDAVANVVVRAEARDRRIVSWSEHDLEVVRSLRSEDPELVARFEARYGNARAVAQRWRNRCHDGDKPGVGRLADYLALIGYPVSEDAAPGHVGDTIRLLRPRLERGLPLSRAQLGRWERLVEHNRRDCDGMRDVCLLATTQIVVVDLGG
jgi:hypothetical protein